ncbi:MAG: hypothetical protein AAB460_03100 [Patescibacteria group bacterium]
MSHQPPSESERIFLRSVYDDLRGFLTSKEYPAAQRALEGAWQAEILLGEYADSLFLLTSQGLVRRDEGGSNHYLYDTEQMWDVARAFRGMENIALPSRVIADMLRIVTPN